MVYHLDRHIVMTQPLMPHSLRAGDAPRTGAPPDHAPGGDGPLDHVPVGAVAPTARPAVLPAALPPTAPGTDRLRLGVLTMCAVSLIFALQDAVSRHMGSAYPPLFVTMIRYWFFALFVIVMAARGPGGLRAAIRTRHPAIQIFRGLLLVAEVVMVLVSFVKLGLVGTHAIFTVSPLLVVALSGPVLGEKVGWRRWLAVGVGFVGILIILRPGAGVLSPWAALPFLAALMFAIYVLLTRMVSADDSAQVSFFWTGIAGAVGITAVGIWQATPIARPDWPWMAALCLTGVAGHFLLIRAYELAEASSLQPFAYTQLVWVVLIGVFLLGETVQPNVIAGMAIIVGAGLFTWWRTMRRAQERTPQG